MNVFERLREKIEAKRLVHNELSGDVRLSEEEQLIQTRLDGCFSTVMVIVDEVEKEAEEDFCEWKFDGVMYDRNPHEGAMFARTHNFSDEEERMFLYCPYCSKKIKTVY